MRFDLIPERDRFIPGWHSRPDTLRAEFARPERQWPSRLRRAARAFLSSLLRACRAAAGWRSGSTRHARRGKPGSSEKSAGQAAGAESG
jgi:hypothetical protein